MTTIIILGVALYLGSICAEQVQAAFTWCREALQFILDKWRK